MAFDRDNFAKISSGYAHVVSPQMFSYLSPTDDIEAMQVSGYFDEVNAETDIVRIGDLFLLDPPATHATLTTILSLDPIVLGPAVEAGAIADGSVTTPKLADLAVTTGKIDLSAVTTSKLQDFSVTTEKLDTDSVTREQLADFAVTTPKLEVLAVTTPNLADLAVTTAKLANEAVTAAKIEPGVLGSFKIINIFEISAGTQVTKVIGLPNALPGDFATAAFSFNNSLVVFIIESRFVDPASITVSFNFAPGVSDKIQIFHYRANI